jgi:hypothetical protein
MVIFDGHLKVFPMNKRILLVTHDISLKIERWLDSRKFLSKIPICPPDIENAQRYPGVNQQRCGKYMGFPHFFGLFIELDDGKILTGKPDQFDGKNHGFRLRFSLKPIH